MRTEKRLPMSEVTYVGRKADRSKRLFVLRRKKRQKKTDGEGEGGVDWVIGRDRTKIKIRFIL